MRSDRNIQRTPRRPVQRDDTASNAPASPTAAPSAPGDAPAAGAAPAPGPTIIDPRVVVTRREPSEAPRPFYRDERGPRLGPHDRPERNDRDPRGPRNEARPSHDGRDARSSRDGRDGRDRRDPRDPRDGRDGRDGRQAHDGRDGRDRREGADRGRWEDRGPRSAGPGRDRMGQDSPHHPRDRYAIDAQRHGQRFQEGGPDRPRRENGPSGERPLVEPWQRHAGQQARQRQEQPWERRRDERGPAPRGDGPRDGGWPARSDRPGERFDRGPRPERGERPQRPERFERTDRFERTERQDRPQRFDRPDRPAPGPRAEHSERNQAPRPETAAPQEGVRLSKLMTERGLASRREADEWIDAGWVKVNGVMAVLGQRVTPEVEIEVDPAARRQQAQRVTVLVHKPIGYVSGQAEDGYQPASALVTPENHWAEDPSRKEFHPGHVRGLAPAGRLDIDSTGLLVLTQDGRIAKHLIGDDSEVEKEYLVRVVYQREGAFPEESLHLLNHGLELDGHRLRPAKVSWANEDQLRFVLREGRKRQIRRMCELVGLKVVGLKRVRIGSVVLGKLPAGQWRYLREDERF